jgi:hypothetical protein
MANSRQLVICLSQFLASTIHSNFNWMHKSTHFFLQSSLFLSSYTGRVLNHLILLRVWHNISCMINYGCLYSTSNQGHFTHETESLRPIHFKHSQMYSIWWKSRSLSKYASHYAWGTNKVFKCKMDVKSTWIPTWHQMDHVSWSLGLFSKTTSWR